VPASRGSEEAEQPTAGPAAVVPTRASATRVVRPLFVGRLGLARRGSPDLLFFGWI
jgi:hypothetical protein